MSTLEMFHDFMEIIRRYMQIPPPKPTLGEFIQAEITTEDGKKRPMQFAVEAQRDGLLVFGRICVKDRGWSSGLVSSIEFDGDSLTVIIQHSLDTTDITKLGKMPLTDLLDFHEIKPRDATPFLPQKGERRKPVTKNCRRQGERCGHRHTIINSTTPIFQPGSRP